MPSLTRCFSTMYSAAKSTISQEGDWTRYEDTVGIKANNTIYTDKTIIGELVKNCRTVYEQDDIDDGCFVSFKTENGDTSICFIPDGKLPSSIKF